MSTLTKKRAGLKITLPQSVVEKFGFESEKDIDLVVMQEGALLKPKNKTKMLSEIKEKMEERVGLTKDEMEIAARAGLIDRDQFYYWTPEWQKGVKKSEEDYKAGRYKELKDLKDLDTDLKE